MAIDFAELNYPLEKWHRRVWSKVTKGAPDECWLWHGATVRGSKHKTHQYKVNPYPVLGFWCPQNGKRRVRQIRVHRLIYWLEDASLYPTDIVRHTCNNALCCNPAHLVIGTHQDNMDDMVRSGRSTRGASNPNAKLTQSQVDEARVLHDRHTWTHKTLAKRYGVSKSAIRKVISGERWGPGQ